MESGKEGTSGSEPGNTVPEGRQRFWDHVNRAAPEQDAYAEVDENSRLSLRRGQTVRLHSLQQLEHNCAVGRLGTYSARKGRWSVHLIVDGTGTMTDSRLGVRPRNLYKYPVLQEGDPGFQMITDGVAVRSIIMGNLVERQFPRDEIIEMIHPCVAHLLPAETQAFDYYSDAAQLIFTTELHLNLVEGPYKQWSLLDLATEDHVRDWRPPCFGNGPGDLTDLANHRQHTAAGTVVGRAVTRAELADMRAEPNSTMRNLPNDFI